MQEQKSSFPFSMVERMMPMYPAIAVMGWMFVLIAFLVGLWLIFTLRNHPSERLQERDVRPL